MSFPQGGISYWALRWAVVLNVTYLLIEAGAGIAVGSLALLADAAHNLIDVAGLLIAWGARIAAVRPPSERFSYGFGRTTILAALANAITILIGVGADCPGKRYSGFSSRPPCRLCRIS